MKLKNIKFDDDSTDEVYPDKIIVEMTLDEAAWICLVSGKQRGESPHSSIFDCLSSDVFNRYWDNGVDELKNKFPIPPIVYKD